MEETKQQLTAEQQPIRLNGQPLSEAEFQRKKQELEHQPGTRLVEVAPNEYRIQIQG